MSLTSELEEDERPEIKVEKDIIDAAGNPLGFPNNNVLRRKS